MSGRVSEYGVGTSLSATTSSGAIGQGYRVRSGYVLPLSQGNISSLVGGLLILDPTGSISVPCVPPEVTVNDKLCSCEEIPFTARLFLTCRWADEETKKYN